MRTNHYMRADALALKLDSSAIALLPEPRPWVEVFVYSQRTEGVHLRGGPIARGGLRWSDRHEDFRTEVLGLMKAQMVKNALIVPVGAKGGFVVKRSEPVVDAYRTFVGALLDVTDNVVEGEIVPPERVVRHDGDDPYLVVAADKGTATFSDVANEIAVARGFWLGDAFASGGSAGYDHKRMGITARGAWESVRRHFRGLGVDVMKEDVTVVGIGDMSGDVFGNGMLLSPHIRLVAAFDHRHVFLDPDPDAAAGYAERERLFGLARSSWDDYDRERISVGGGVFPRTAKSIPLSPEARRALGVEAEALSPAELVQAILRAPVDLLWSGGIGTYVKSTHESHADVGDRSNDAVRVNGAELRCRVVGEGGNLGLTQHGRVEYALAGGRLFTDAIDNAGGVNCSDHEVNIKILLHGAIDDGSLAAADRDALLALMRDAVGDRVIEANRAQALALSLEHHDAPHLLDGHVAVIRTLEARGVLDRELEGLPGDEELADRRGAGLGLTQPELAVLLAYAKMTLRDELVASAAPEDPWLSRELAGAFPSPLPERYGDAMRAHRLRREIVATRLTNRLVDRGGIGHALRLHDDVGATVGDIARATAIAWEVHALDALWDDVEALGDEAPAAPLAEVLLEAQRLATRATRWVLLNRRGRWTSHRPWRRSARTCARCRGCCRRSCTAPGARRSRSASRRGRRRACPRRSRAVRRVCSRWRRRSTSPTSPPRPARRSGAPQACTGCSASGCRWTGSTRSSPRAGATTAGRSGADVAARRPVRRAPYADRARAARGPRRRSDGARRRMAGCARRGGRPRARAARRRAPGRRERPRCAGRRGARGQRAGGVEPRSATMRTSTSGRERAAAACGSGSPRRPSPRRTDGAPSRT